MERKTISNVISQKTARNLSLLHVQAAISEQNLKSIIKYRYSECFKSVGKLNGCTIKLHSDPQCEPMAQQVIGFPLVIRIRSVRCLSVYQLTEDITEPR